MVTVTALPLYCVICILVQSFIIIPEKLEVVSVLAGFRTFSTLNEKGVPAVKVLPVTVSVACIVLGAINVQDTVVISV